MRVFYYFCKDTLTLMRLLHMNDTTFKRKYETPTAEAIEVLFEGVICNSGKINVEYEEVDL